MHFMWFTPDISIKSIYCILSEKCFSDVIGLKQIYYFLYGQMTKQNDGKMLLFEEMSSIKKLSLIPSAS